MEQIEVEAYNYQTKKQNLKIQFITFTDQLKFNKSEDFYKAFTLKLTKKGKYTAKISFKGDKTYKASKKSIKITIK